MRVTRETAWILSRRDWSETSLILECFTREHGRIGLLARGARRRKEWAHHVLSPFQRLSIGFVGRGELPILTEAEVHGGGAMLVPPRVYLGYYVNELIVRLLTRHDPHEGLFAAYERAMMALQSDEASEPALRIFEKNLLKELGYGLNLVRCAGTQEPVQEGAQYDYGLESGPVEVREVAADYPWGGVPVSGRCLVALEREELNDPAILRESKRLMRAAIGQHLGPKPLESRKLLESLARYTADVAGAEDA